MEWSDEEVDEGRLVRRRDATDLVEAVVSGLRRNLW